MTAVAASGPARLAVQDAVRLLRADPTRLLGRHVGVELRHGPTVRQEVDMELGPPETDAAGTRWPIAWQPAGHTTVLPAFDGTLELRPDGEDTVVTIAGDYAPPLGRVGVIVDRAIGHRVAEVTVEGVVRALARRLEVACRQSAASTRR